MEVFECDKCGQEGACYLVTFPKDDGGTEVKEFIRCERHNTQFEKLKEDPSGEWRKRGRRAAFKKVDPKDIK